MSAVIQSQPGPTGASQTSAHGGAQPLAQGAAGRAIAFDACGDIALDTFFSHVRGLAAQLPDATHAVNLCEDRYRFLVAFCAVALRGQTTLLPPSRTRGAIDDVRAQHPGSYCIGDGEPCACEHADLLLADPLLADPLQVDPVQAGLMPLPHYVRLPDVLPRADGPRPQIDDDALVAIGFTSGSTGAPKPNAKSWRSFRTSTAQNIAALDGLTERGAAPQAGTLHVVATVPPQHMYGMEMSVLLPLHGDVAVHGARPFFPIDVANALHAARAPRLLVTTPVHLRALVESGVALPPLAGIVTATAPLPQVLAASAEARFDCEVREMFGSTETCVFARRRTATEEAWTPLPGVRVSPQPDGTLIHAAHLPQPVVLADLMEVLPDGRFLLRGRQADLLEIAGKRASLGDLTRRLLAIPGVDDGVVFQLDEVPGESGNRRGVRRIAALFVALDRTEADVLQALRSSVDPVFLPRRLQRVAALPRNETGKLPRAMLLQLLQGNSR